MWIRNFKGELVFFDITKYHDEKTLYIALWKIKFDKDMYEEHINFNRELQNLILS